MKVLMLAYYFPPDSSSGSFRPFFFANHLLSMGAEITVLTVKESDFLSEQPVNYDLLEKLDNQIDVVRTNAWRPREYLIDIKKKIVDRNKNSEHFTPKLGDGECDSPSFFQSIKDTVTDLLSCPDPHVGWIPSAVRKGLTVIEEKEIDVIWATGSPWSCFIVGALLRKKTGCPLVLDFRDPWVANPNFIRRGRISSIIERKMEHALVVRNDAIIANTDELRGDFIERYGLHPDKIFTITNGFEGYVENGDRTIVNTKFTIVHAGALYFSRNPRLFLEAVLILLTNGSLNPDFFQIQFVGGISIADQSLDNLLLDPILQKVVSIIPRVSYEKATEYQMKADVLLLIQPNFPLQVPRKLYEYISVKRPLLAITEMQGATANLIRCNSLGRIVENKVSSLQKIILEMYRDWQEGKSSILPERCSNKFQNHYLAERLYEILQDMNENSQLH